MAMKKNILVDAITFGCNVLNPRKNLIESYAFNKTIEVLKKSKVFKMVVKPIRYYNKVLKGTLGLNINKSLKYKSLKLKEYNKVLLELIDELEGYKLEKMNSLELFMEFKSSVRLKTTLKHTDILVNLVCNFFYDKGANILNKKLRVKEIITVSEIKKESKKFSTYKDQNCISLKIVNNKKAGICKLKLYEKFGVDEKNRKYLLYNSLTKKLNEKNFKNYIIRLEITYNQIFLKELQKDKLCITEESIEYFNSLIEYVSLKLLAEKNLKNKKLLCSFLNG